MNRNLREINAQMQQNKQPEEGEIMDKLINGWTPPELPNKLPRVLQLLLKPFPKQYHSMLAITASIALGPVSSHFRSRYIDGREIAPNLYGSIIGESASGKSFIPMLTRLITNPTLKVWDDEEFRKLSVNQKEREQNANAKEKPLKYHTKLRMMQNMSKTSFLELQNNLGDNGMLYCEYTESDQLFGLNKQQFSNMSELLRKAWDGDTVSQYYSGEGSINVNCRMWASVIVTGTPKAVLKRLFADVENGFMQRFIHVMVPKTKITFRPPKYTPLSSDEQMELDGLMKTLFQKDLDLGDNTKLLDLPKTERMVEKFYNSIEVKYNNGELTKAEVRLSNRIGQFMQRAAIPLVALYGEERKEITDFCTWLGTFAYSNICQLFGAKVARDIRENE